MSFDSIRGRLGFGCMRLPMRDGEVDTREFSEMVDIFMDAGFNYFDTASGYLDGKSETAIRECVAKRYPRDSFILTNKLSSSFFKTEQDIRPLFERQLAACGVDYFDIYLMHSQDAVLYEKYKAARAYETALELKGEGKIRHFGISFHDKAAVLEEIFNDYPEIEVVQIQFNYLDYEDASVESRKCYEVCRKHGKRVLIMEPVKGGVLANLPERAANILSALESGSAASYAVRFAAGFDGVISVLSGMSNVAQVRDNVSYMRKLTPLDAREMAAINEVREVIRSMELIACTACRYCTPSCPAKIPIPDLFACMNGKELWKGWNADYYYEIHTQSGGLASACIRCGRCEKICPQHLPIRELLARVADTFEKK